MINQVAIDQGNEAVENQNDNLTNKVERIEAIVKWYNAEKGYGFLIPENDSGDIFMHFSVLDAAGCRRVEEGDRMLCDIGPGRRGKQVLRILEVKFSSRDQNFSPAFLCPFPSAFDPNSLEEVEGTVKWFNPLKGYGFIYPDDGSRDIFLHASVLRSLGYNSLEPGIRVLVKVSSSERGREVRSLEILQGPFHSESAGY